MNRRHFIRNAAGLMVPAMLPGAVSAGAMQMLGGGRLHVADEGPTGEALYSDDFESATLESGISGRGNDDFMWDPSNPSSSSVIVRNNQAVSGTKSLEFPYIAVEDTGGDDGQNLEQRFTLADRHQEIWLGFKLWIPPDFENVSQSGGSSNKKFLALWCEDVYAGWGACIFEHLPDGAGNSTLSPTYRDETNSSSHGFADDVVFIDKTADAGTWMTVGVHVIQTTNSETTGSGTSYRGHGTVEVWKNNSLFRSITNFPNYNPDGNHLKYGYLMGAANGGYRVATPFAVDDFVIATNEGAIADYLP